MMFVRVSRGHGHHSTTLILCFMCVIIKIKIFKYSYIPAIQSNKLSAFKRIYVYMYNIHINRHMMPIILSYLLLQYYQRTCIIICNKNVI